MGNPLINELIIGTGDKDKFSMSAPKDDAQFANYFLDPLLARVINAAYAGAVPIPAPPRKDLLPLVQYMAPICPSCSPGPVADLLRLNTGIPPTPRPTASDWAFSPATRPGFPTAAEFPMTSPTSRHARWSAFWRALRSIYLRTIASATR